MVDLGNGESNAALGYTSARPPRHRHAFSIRSFARYLVVNFIDSLDIWLVYQGLKKGISLSIVRYIAFD